MNERISLLVSDVDGTLVTDKKELTAVNIRAAAKLGEAGVKLSLVSSRPPIGFAKLTKQLALSAPLGAFNGGAIVKPDLTLIEEVLVPADAARLAIDTLRSFGIDVWLFTSDSWYVTDPDGAYVPKERVTIAHEPKVVESFEPLLGRIGKLVGSSRDFDAVAKCEAELERRLGSAASAKRSQQYYIDVTPHGSDKGHAVRRIAAVLNVPIDEVAVIGDMTNDRPMFDVAPHKIAMGNAIEELKTMASFVTDSNQDSGFAAAVERYILPRAPTSVRSA